MLMLCATLLPMRRCIYLGGNRCILPFDGKVAWNSASKGNSLPNPPKGRKGRCYDKSGTWTSDVTKTAHNQMCGLYYSMKKPGKSEYGGKQWMIWTVDPSYTEAPCSGDSIGRIWVGDPHQVMHCTPS